MNVDGQGKRVGDIGDFASVSSDVLASLSAPSGRSTNQPAHPIFKRKGRAVQFWLGEEASRPRGCGVDEVVQLLRGGGLVQAAHGKEVVHFDTPWSDVGPHAAELWVIRIKGLEFVPQAVEFCIAEFGLSEVVVEVRMVSDLLRQ